MYCVNLMHCTVNSTVYSIKYVQSWACDTCLTLRQQYYLLIRTSFSLKTVLDCRVSCRVSCRMCPALKIASRRSGFISSAAQYLNAPPPPLCSLRGGRGDLVQKPHPFLRRLCVSARQRCWRLCVSHLAIPALSSLRALPPLSLCRGYLSPPRLTGVLAG